MRINKATETNSISLKILKLANEPMLEHLYAICNLFFTTGTVLDSFKLAKVTPVYKKKFQT